MSWEGASVAATVPVYPGLRAGHRRHTAKAVEIWLQVAWLMLAEGRAYIEDLEGGMEQPQMQQAAKLRLLEQLADIDNRLAGRMPVADEHCLATALEYGMRELIAASGTEMIEIFGLVEELGGDSCTVSGIYTLWQRLLDGYPGELPDRLMAQGQRDMLRTLQTWAALARSAGLDVGILTPFMKDALFMRTESHACVVEAHAPLSAASGQRVWSLLGDALPSITGHVLEVADTPQGQRWTVLLNGSRVHWVQRTVVAGDRVRAFEQVSGDLAELQSQWAVADGRLSLTIRFHLGVDGLAPLLNPIWTQAFQAFADEVVRSMAATVLLRPEVTA